MRKVFDRKSAVWMMSALLMLSVTACAKTEPGKQPTVPILEPTKTVTNTPTTPVPENVTILEGTFCKQEGNGVIAIKKINDHEILVQETVDSKEKESGADNQFYFSEIFNITNGTAEWMSTDQNGNAFSSVITFAEEGKTVKITHYGTWDNPEADGTFVYEGTEAVFSEESMVKYLGGLSTQITGIKKDFGKDNPYEVFSSEPLGQWFCLVDAYDWEEDRLVGRYYVAEDLSAVFQYDASLDENLLIYGSAGNTLNKEYACEIENEEDQTVETLTLPLIYAVVTDGTVLEKGAEADLSVVAPLDLSYGIRPISWESEKISVDGTRLTAVEAGETKLQVEITCCDVKKTCEIALEIVDEDGFFTETMAMEDAARHHYEDRVSERAVLEIYEENGVIGVDIMWADSGFEQYHWSYIGSRDEKDKNVIHLLGSCYLEKEGDGKYSEECLFEGGEGKLVLKDEVFYWTDDVEDSGKDCEFVIVYEE